MREVTRGKGMLKIWRSGKLVCWSKVWKEKKDQRLRALYWWIGASAYADFFFFFCGFILKPQSIQTLHD